MAFAANAGDVLAWAGVPRKSDELLAGYQRFKDDTRIKKEIVPFFGEAGNCSPTAAIVALREDSGLGSCRLEREPTKAGEIIQTNLVVTVRDELWDSDEIFEIALKYVDARLAGEQEPADADEDPDDDESGEDGTDDDSEDAIHLGTATLARMRSLLTDKANWSSKEFRQAIVDYVKPAFLIDGQHRISAAARFGDNGLPFMVCGLYNATWPEQVFQFTVVNLKPKRIPPALITSIAAMSLTRDEQEKLSTRLERSGVRMREVEVMSRVAYGDESPFADHVNMAVSGGSKAGDSLLGYAGVKRIANEWYRCRRSSLLTVAKQLTGLNNSGHARAQWQQDAHWFDFFASFWRTVQGIVGVDLWKKQAGNSLFVAANLWALQESILVCFDTYPSSTWQVDDGLDLDERANRLRSVMAQSTTELMNCFPQALWTASWHTDYKQNATSDKRDKLMKAFLELINEGKQSSQSHWKAWQTKSPIIVGN